MSVRERRPEEIEDDIEQTRAEIGDTLEALERRLSPDHLLDQVIDYFRGPNEFGSNLARQIRDNPIPVALIGVGIAWLLLAGRREPRARYDRMPPGRVPLPHEGYSRYPFRGYGDPYRDYDDDELPGAYATAGAFEAERDLDEEEYAPYADYDDEDVTVSGAGRASGGAAVYDETVAGARAARGDPLTSSYDEGTAPGTVRRNDPLGSSSGGTAPGGTRSGDPLGSGMASPRPAAEPPRAGERTET